MSLEQLDPVRWVQAIGDFVATTPYAVEILLAFAGIAVVRWALVPLIRAFKR
jgi:hypothetical protein